MKISVVIPSFNHAHFLPATLESVLQQGYRDLEILVYDGGSSDDTLSILQSYGNRIEFVSEADRGQADAINRGLQRASGDIVAYLNSDDVYFPDALNRVIAHFTHCPDCDVLYGDAWHLYEDGSIMEPYYTERWSYARLFDLCYLCQPAVFWRREVMEHFGIFDRTLHYAMDYDYWLRIGRAREFHYLEGAYLSGSRLHQDTKTLKHRVKAHHEILQVVMRHASEPPYRWLMNLASVIVDQQRIKEDIAVLDEKVRRTWFVKAVLENANLYRMPLNTGFLNELERLL